MCDMTHTCRGRETSKRACGHERQSEQASEREQERAGQHGRAREQESKREQESARVTSKRASKRETHTHKHAHTCTHTYPACNEALSRTRVLMICNFFSRNTRGRDVFMISPQNTRGGKVNQSVSCPTHVSMSAAATQLGRMRHVTY